MRAATVEPAATSAAAPAAPAATAATAVIAIATALAVLTIATALAVLTIAAPSAAAYAAATKHATATATATDTVTRSAHVAFGVCNTRRVILSVTAPTHPFTPNEPVTIKVLLRNTGSTTCGGPLAQHVPQARQKLTVGPCGTMSLVVRNSTGVEVYPGPAVFHCPAEMGFQLGPHSTARATATWSEAADVGLESNSAPQLAPPGMYRLSVDGVVTVPVTLTSA
ncbi:MAG: hypothetical protein WAL61_10930 [Acidimicrobiales bacterium]